MLFIWLFEFYFNLFFVVFITKKSKLAIEISLLSSLDDTTALISSENNVTSSKADEIFGETRNNSTVTSEPNLLNVTRSGLLLNTTDPNQSLDQNSTSFKPNLNVTANLTNNNSLTTPLLNFTLNDSFTDLVTTNKLNDQLTTNNQSTNTTTTTTTAATATSTTQNRTDKGYSSNSECYFPFTYKVSFFTLHCKFFVEWILKKSKIIK